MLRVWSAKKLTQRLVRRVIEIMCSIEFPLGSYLPSALATRLYWCSLSLILIPYYSSAEFNYLTYAGLPFMEAIASELSEHYIPLPMFFIALALLLPLVAIFTMLAAWTLRKISEAASRIRFISQPLYIMAIMLILISFLPMVWIVRESKIISALLTVEAAFVYYSRVYVGLHYPLDVEASIFLAVAIVIIGLFVLERYLNKPLKRIAAFAVRIFRNGPLNM